MLSPAARHRQRVETTVKNPSVEVVVSSQESVLISQFKSDKQRLSVIRSASRRTEAKRVLLPNYDTWVNAIIEAGDFNQEQEHVFVWLLLWHVDVGEWQKAVDMAVFALDHGMKAPLNFSRTLLEVVVEQVSDGIRNTGSPDKHNDVLDILLGLLGDEDMADQITAKLYKSCGLACMSLEPKRALVMFEKALQLNPRSGVKQLIKQIGDSAMKKSVEKTFPLSSRDAAKLLGVSLPAVLRHARKYPEKLVHHRVMQGSRTVFKFNKDDVEKYKKELSE